MPGGPVYTIRLYILELVNILPGYAVFVYIDILAVYFRCSRLRIIRLDLGGPGGPVYTMRIYNRAREYIARVCCLCVYRYTRRVFQVQQASYNTFGSRGACIYHVHIYSRMVGTQLSQGRFIKMPICPKALLSQNRFFPKEPFCPKAHFSKL